VEICGSNIPDPSQNDPTYSTTLLESFSVPSLIENVSLGFIGWKFSMDDIQGRGVPSNYGNSSRKCRNVIKS